MKKLAPLAALAAVAALALPVASWADDTTHAQPQGSGARLTKIQERIQKVEARIDAATARIARLQQKLDEHCTAATQPAAGADRCARAQARLDKVKERLQKAQDRLATVEARLQKWLDEHGGQMSASGGSGLSAADQAALGQLQQQLAGLQG